MENEQLQRILDIRRGLVEGHHKYLDGGMSPDVAMCRQKDMAFVLERAIKQLDGILEQAGVSFQ